MKQNGRTLVDGSVLDPVPVALARSLAPHLPVVAVTLSPPVDSWVRRPTPRVLGSLPFLGKYLERSRWAQALNIFLGADFRPAPAAGPPRCDRSAAGPPDRVARPGGYPRGRVPRGAGDRGGASANQAAR
jgi:predicted acylesterase/phospholipase RssA